ncbi:MAG: hypothetical protein K6E93_06535 [Bacteroidales bacterium]|nr:hypothetical protein [Bacteroidales bacterium]
MKNVFKFLGIALLASSLVFASCGKDEETETPGTENNGGNNNGGNGGNGGGTTYAVNFGIQGWNPQYMNAQWASNALMLAFAKTSSTSYPICQITYSVGEGESVANGTFNGSPSMEADDQGQVSIGFGSPRVWYFESGTWDLSGTSGTIHTGDWWGKTVTMTIANLDATAMTADINVSAQLAHVTEMLNDQGQLTTTNFDDVTSKAFTANFPGQQFTAYTGKSVIAKDATAKLAR